MRNKLILLGFVFVFGCCANSAEAWRAGPRVGAFADHYEDTCNDNREWGLGAAWQHEPTIEKRCTGPRCGGGVTAAASQQSVSPVPYYTQPATYYAPASGYGVTRIIEYGY